MIYIKCIIIKHKAYTICAILSMFTMFTFMRWLVTDRTCLICNHILMIINISLYLADVEVLSLTMCTSYINIRYSPSKFCNMLSIF